MVFCALILRPRVNRIANIALSIVYALTIIAGAVGEWTATGSARGSRIPERPACLSRDGLMRWSTQTPRLELEGRLYAHLETAIPASC